MHCSKAYLPSIRCKCYSLPSVSIQSPLACSAILRHRARHTAANEYEFKYAQKLRERAEEKGLSIDELKAKSREEQEGRIRQSREFIKSSTSSKPERPQRPATTSTTSNSPASPESSRRVLPSATTVRRDSSPVKPLASILNLSRIISTPHSPAQISALWTAYHVSRSGGTGRGYLCASIPLNIYQNMAGVAEKYPSFIIPIPRMKDPAAAQIDEESTAYEFFFLQWGFHGAPPAPHITEADPFTSVTPPSNTPSESNPQTSTILFTPLQEYKLRGSFATPYLVLTHYTDFAQTHGIVLLRGEITPSAAADSTGAAERYLLSQKDAHFLSMGIQKFYLWDGEDKEAKPIGNSLLKKFHEKPEEFKWEEFLRHVSQTT